MTSPDPALATAVARAELMKRVLIVITAIMVATALVLILVTLFRVGDVIDEIRATQQSGSPAVKAATDAAESAQEAAESSKATNDQILDCLQPTGVCYQDSQQRTAALVTNFNRVVIYAAACASGPVKLTVEEIQACVIGRLAQDPPPEQP
jgi:hypothetical protein